jgi:hypothetical protein
MNAHRPSLLLVLVLALLSSAALARPLALLPAGALVVETDAIAASTAALADAKAAQLQVDLHGKGATAALQSLSDLQDPLAYELTAAVLIAELQNGQDSAAVREILGELVRVPTKVFRRHEETRGDWFVPLIDVSGRARFALRALDAGVLRKTWKDRLSADPARALDDVGGLQPEQHLVIAEAMAELDEQSVARLAEYMKSGNEQQPSVFWRALAERSSDPAVYAAAARACSDADLIRLLPTAKRQLASADAERWLLAMAERKALQSAALLALAPLADSDSQALVRLVNSLDMPASGASAAAALAARPQGDRLDLIRSLAADPAAGGERLTWLALALRLEGSKEALGELRHLAVNPRLPVSVREELSR